MNLKRIKSLVSMKKKFRKVKIHFAKFSHWLLPLKTNSERLHFFFENLSKYEDELSSVKTTKLKFENEFKKNQILGKHEEKNSQGENSPCQIFALATPLKNQSREIAF